MRIPMLYRSLLSVGMLVLMLLCGVSCEHRPLEDPSERRFIRVYLDEHIKNVTYGFYDESRQETDYTTPKVLRIGFYDHSSGNQVYEGYLQKSGTDDLGNYVEGLIPSFDGKYSMLISRFDNTSTYLRNENRYGEAQAYTKPVSNGIMQSLSSLRDASRADASILNQPDHFFVKSSESINLYKSAVIDTLRDENGDFFVAKSVVKTYYLQVNVKGAEYVSSASCYLTGVAGSVNLANQTLNEEDVSSVFFQLKSDHVSNRSEFAQAYTTFNTFGKIPSAEGILTVVFEFKTKYGTTQVEKIELNDLFETDMVKNEQWIIIDKVIEIIPNATSGGGMQPTVGGWGTVNGDITI